jgi:nitrate/nitrite transporter NarK
LKTWQLNAEHLKAGVPKQHRYKFKQVAILDWAYLVTFGTELAVVSILAINNDKARSMKGISCKSKEDRQWYG